jgi:hypothetical protein
MRNLKMRSAGRRLGGIVVAATLGAVAVAGCWDAHGELFLTLTDPALATWGTGGSSSSSTGTSGTGGASPDCSGDPNETNVIDACGVFVQADATGATEDGTQAHPYKTLQQGIDNAGSKRVYACASAPYSEAVTIAAPVEMYGGFDCAKGWGWKADARSALNGPAGAVALTLTKQGDGAKVQGFAVTAASATVKGGASIAVAVENVAAALIRCEVTAGDAMAGEDGVTPAGTPMKGADAPPPVATTMNACANLMFLAGGAAGTTTCEDGVSAGGVGGKGGITATMSGDGAAGADGTLADAVNGIGGAGESLTKCLVGAAGKDGDAGQVGDAGLSPGALSLMGLSDTNMTDGKPGTRGNGGGGGGGAKSGMFCPGGVDGNGASGGGGGAGGCGGLGGGGGKAGGSSIAIVSLGTKLTLTDVALKTGKGGAGGKGAIGQSGGDPGAGATGGAKSGIGASNNGCKGGDGGSGGLGGSGGGGRGGHSVGIAYASAPTKGPTLKGFAGDTMGLGGAAGPSNPTGKGAVGAAGACWDFSKNKACLP